MGSIKENLIRNYVSNINFKSENWGLSQIKEDMRKNNPLFNIKLPK